ncbi:MAG: hypothetical protein K6B72_04500 [Lachnospiraceae bacterium]|nr:hypothetical protein [Lachnospiraceae bacterium]
MDHRIFSFTGIYTEQDFWREPADQAAGSCFYDFTHLSGTRGYLSEEAAAVLTEQIAGFPAERPMLAFIDSGNYHYMAKLLTGRLTEDFTLVLLDHHPDMQLPAFGGLLSCGGWVRAALLENPHLREVWFLGVDERLAREALADDPGEWIPDSSLEGVLCREFSDRQLLLVPDPPAALPAAADLPDTSFSTGAGQDAQSPLYLLLEEILRHSPLPFYLSIDKDVLSPADVYTDWDQGTMTADTLYAIVRFFIARVPLLGADICGECDASASVPANYLQENDLCNRKLLDIFRKAL